MQRITSYAGLEKLGRVRLSQFFFMRDFLYSEISNFHAIPNLPENPDLAIETGSRLCQELLDPLVKTFGPITVRSSYRGMAVNGYGSANGLNCAQNEKNYAGHIWDKADAEGRIGATACISVPWFADQYENGRDWRDLAWWVHDHLPYSGMYFFPWRAAFNLTWSDVPRKGIASYIAPKGNLLRPGQEPQESLTQRQTRYHDFPTFGAISYPR